MSHPDRFTPPGGESVDTIPEPPTLAGKSAESLAEFAARHGLTQSAARPPLRTYIQDLWQRRTFIWNFASAKSMSMYTSSRLGQVWQVLTPLLNAGVYYLIFGLLLGTNKGVSNYSAFLITGVFVFTFTQRSLTAGARSVGNNLSLIRALHFPRASLPFAMVIVELQQLLVSMCVLAVIVVVTGEPLSWHWLLVLPVLVLQLIFNMGISLVIARMGAFVRDIQQLLPFVTRTWLYFSGIFFMTASLAEKDALQDYPWIAKVLEANPASVYIELVRTSLLDSYRGDLAAHHWGHTHLWWYALAWALVAFVGGFWYFHRAEERYGRG
ncbi:teichoic acid transport system permease protein [Thermomonospora echinospora]|uniref:Transport permease protein n=1 Tax=Thermomonospora echinospora TaxID=1992 RepID=A0A1H6E8I0_9ACTN|nr:ABC transporter permease [Thermomonospora echinospora]SEG93165.1 teichoic acid transport system permease protein [Thermomonospora echinospora]